MSKREKLWKFIKHIYNPAKYQYLNVLQYGEFDIEKYRKNI